LEYNTGLSSFPQVTVLINGGTELDLRTLDLKFQIIPICTYEAISFTKPGSHQP
jgi:hypothetical protein